MPGNRNFRSKRVKLIFNPVSGAADESPVQLMDIIRVMQDLRLVPEPFLIEPGCDLAGVIDTALAQGIRLFAACGGDGTIASVARRLVGSRAALGIIPTGTQNNIALSLGIPREIPAAAAVLRSGRRLKVDAGWVTCGSTTMPFFEVCSVGLVSSIFSSVDEIQHGNLARVADFLTTLAASPPAEIHLRLEGKRDIRSLGHVLLVSNMPRIGFHYQVGAPGSFQDGWLDVLFFSNLSKLELLNYVFQGGVMDRSDDPRVLQVQVRRLDITTSPAMQVMADGIDLGSGAVRIRLRRRALTVMAPLPQPGEIDI